MGANNTAQTLAALRAAKALEDQNAAAGIPVRRKNAAARLCEQLLGLR